MKMNMFSIVVKKKYVSAKFAHACNLEVRRASTLNLGILGKIYIFAYDERAFHSSSWKKIRSLREKFLLMACIFMSKFIGSQKNWVEICWLNTVYSDLTCAIEGYLCIFMRF